jgi:dTDP-4-dehydrorhamnose reductase
MKVLITGASGQLGHDAAAHFQQLGHEVYGLSSQEMDITDLLKVQQTIERIKPSLIIHSAAYTLVDQDGCGPSLPG